MRIIAPSATIETPIDSAAIMESIERAGRTSYKSEDRIDEGSAEKFIRMILARGHESVIEHVSISVRFVCDRGVTHEIVRHRLASYTQESTRYCNYGKGKFGSEITVIQPCFWKDGTIGDAAKRALWSAAMEAAEQAYLDLIEKGATAQEARSVLPNSLKTEIVMTANLREWRHFFRLRTSKAAHPQMRQLAVPLLAKFARLLPAIFGDL